MRLFSYISKLTLLEIVYFSVKEVGFLYAVNKQKMQNTDIPIKRKIKKIKYIYIYILLFLPVLKKDLIICLGYS